MGQYLELGLHMDPFNVHRGIVALYEGLRERSDLLGVDVYEGWLADPKLRSAEQDISDSTLEAWIAEVLPSNQYMSIHLVYNAVPGERFPVDIDLNGSQSLMGFGTAIHGTVRLGIFGGIWSRVYLALGPKRWDLRKERDRLGHRTLERYIETLQQVRLETEELLFRACGFPGAATTDSHVRHAMLGGGWESPAICHALYHRDVAEYGRDLTRIYLSYHKGTPIATTLEPATDIWSAHLPEQRPEWAYKLDQPGKDQYQGWAEAYSTPVTAELLNFLEDLIEVEIRRIALLPGERIRELLVEMYVTGEVPDIIVHDFGEAGLALVADPDPELSIWKAYQYIAEHA